LKVAFLAIICLLTVSSQIYAQNWRTYSPPDNSFTIEVPALMRRVTWFEGQHGIETEPDPDIDKSVTPFAALQSEPQVREYGVVVLDGKSKELPSKNREDRIAGLWFLIGGDDATPTNERIVRVSGFNGKEYVYAKEISDERYTRGRIIDAGEKIYVIVFVAKTAEDLNSSDAERFLNSFRPQRSKIKIGRNYTKRRV
jgi:hypothetical protein